MLVEPSSDRTHVVGGRVFGLAVGGQGILGQRHLCSYRPVLHPLVIGDAETGTIMTGYCDVDCAALPNTASCEAQECCIPPGSDCSYDEIFCQSI